MQQDTEIDVLIAKFFSGEASPEEAMQLEDWAETSPENKSYLTNSAKFFTMNTQSNVIASKPLVWENIRNVVDTHKSAQKGRLINWPWIAVAASVVGILTISLLIYTNINQQNNETFYEAGIAPKKILLQDRSEITISPNSSITVDKDFGTGSRKITLKGSALFSVIHDAARPFIIDMDNLHIKDLGTTFSVKSSPSGSFVFIHVTEGEISVYDDLGSSKKLSAGEKLTLSKSEKKINFIHFERTKESSMPDAQESETGINEPDTTHKRKPGSVAPTTDSLGKGYTNRAYPSPYPLDKSYSPEVKQALMNKNEEAMEKMINDMLKDGLIKEAESVKKITTDMRKDGLITNVEPLSFKLSNRVFIINGKVQSEAVFQRYLKKFGPSLNTTGEWSWTHNYSDPNAKN